ncbi:MAG TPA: hypothetical protein VIV11_19315 [Kofleriaceae bacterium]
MKASAVIVLLAACGPDEIDLTGIYRVDADVASMPCGADQPVAMPPPYLKFAKGAFLGAEYFSMLTCSDEAGTNCTGGGLFGDSFAEPIDGGWRGVIYSASGTMTCLLAYTEQTAILDGAHMVVDTTTYSEEDPTAECTAEEAERRNTQMPCTEHEQIDATRL